MSIPEIILILFVALIVFGPEDLPVIARTLGKIIYQGRQYLNNISKELQETVETPAKVINDSLNQISEENHSNSEFQSKPEELLIYHENSDCIGNPNINPGKEEKE